MTRRRRSTRLAERRVDRLEAQSGPADDGIWVVHAPNAFYDEEGIMQVPEDEHPRYVDSDGHPINENAGEIVVVLSGSPTDDGEAVGVRRGRRMTRRTRTSREAENRLAALEDRTRTPDEEFDLSPLSKEKRGARSSICPGYDRGRTIRGADSVKPRAPR